MEFWFIDDKTKTKVQLPVPPPNFMNEVGKNINILNIADFGEYSRPGDTKLARLGFKSIFPSIRYSWVKVKTITKPYDLATRFENWSEKGTPIRFMVTSTNINRTFLIESFVYGEKDGSSRDVEYEIQLVEYRVPVIKTASKSSSKPRPSSSPSRLKTYTVKKGDTLWDLARKYYGDPYKWKSIASLNGVKNPRKLQIGKVLRLP
ncbi:hypothetical protein CN692_13355 [Bacillus sp. AFS002410]|uniref:LysM peptidoglycan-binding domain-containing protein n=1 Tax=Bacillus sp. AFS002410 TaxID=2033481 RepID=UPI000BF10A5E|nr:LysM peptidoglycan-binding domain-containing protein [Bacillus sp. AFS002410]PEJ57395.1 hypothetical protein CN692_13355 [Bacillus sp. AFS002410]